jgi:hypothetical protein
MNNRLTEEQIREWRAQRPPMIRKPKPKAAAVVAVVDEKTAAAARDNPESVRVWARSTDDTVVIGRPRRSDVVEVLEVDAEGRVALARSYDPATGEHGTIEFEGGYRRQSGAISTYDPFAKGGE